MVCNNISYMDFISRQLLVSTLSAISPEILFSRFPISLKHGR